MTAAARDYDGWWEQAGFGRQPMQQLRLAVARGLVAGCGADIIGPFTLSGEIGADGAVELRKRYQGLHEVRYDGRVDGEGRMWGVWTCGGDSGRWLITQRIDRDESLAELFEVVPAGQVRSAGLS